MDTDAFEAIKQMISGGIIFTMASLMPMFVIRFMTNAFGMSAAGAAGGIEGDIAGMGKKGASMASPSNLAAQYDSAKGMADRFKTGDKAAAGGGAGSATPAASSTQTAGAAGAGASGGAAGGGAAGGAAAGSAATGVGVPVAATIAASEVAKKGKEAASRGKDAVTRQIEDPPM